MRTAALLAASLMASLGMSSSTPVVPQSCVTIERTLSNGSVGVDVSKLQHFLGVKVSGYFGPLTRQKLLAWQFGHGIVTSAKTEGAGTTGPKTRAALKCKAPTAANNSPSAQMINTANPAAGSTTSIPVPVQNPSQNISSPAPVQSGTPAQTSSGGVSPYGYTCASFSTPKPPDAQCAVGSWEKIQDEAGCYVEWGCIDPKDTRG